ncbi:NrfD/PsrC family molybdoenzyme membrane anchor subunit [Actinoalloteichus caeruleus]|uniref:NrfD/PsrC family molybdoenzyme membrane anchor subunit n=1 Tax=Actinoalloteichus cyanogriseus TaxID=2893586 RepID=UPI0004A9F05B|nr:NrfD/PsrC family molybdoenzyme membrane anchor subunit [Actinoalloteichus caeruleus]
MSTSDVTRDGIRGAHPGREARVGGTGEQRWRPRGQRTAAPEYSPDSYYGLPVLNPPRWAATDIAGYFFLGGLAGGSSILAAGGHWTNRPGLARPAKLVALGAVSGSVVALVHDLGRPARFLNMLRVFKITSPMSVGSWLLAAYGPAAGAAAITDLTGWFPRIGATATATAAVLGPLVAAYTAALAADTAVPAWHEGHRELPFVFVSSAALAASGASMIAAPTAQTGPARRAAVLAAAGELAATARMERRMGMVAEPYRTGWGGRLMKAAKALTVAGAVGGALLGRRSRVAAGVCGAALLVGSACTRFGVFHAGMESARDPKYTVEPQRARVRERAARAAEENVA